MENDKGMLVLEFEIILSEETTCRRPDLLWKEKEKKKTPGFAIRHIRDGEKDEIKKKKNRPHPETLSSSLGKEDPVEVLRKRYKRSRFSKTTVPAKRSIVGEMRRTKSKFQ